MATLRKKNKCIEAISDPKISAHNQSRGPRELPDWFKHLQPAWMRNNPEQPSWQQNHPEEAVLAADPSYQRLLLSENTDKGSSGLLW